MIFTPCLLCWLVFVITTGSYRWFITPEMLQQTPGFWYITAGLDDSEWEPGLTLNISSYMTKCLYWHMEMEMWRTDGCQACCDPRGCSHFVMFCCHQSVSLVSGGREKHAGAGAVSVQPPHPVRELFLCKAQWRGHIPHGRSVCHRVAELRGAGAAVCLFWPLPDHSAVGLLLRPQVTLEGQSECCIISCGCAQTVTRNSSSDRKEKCVCCELLPVKTTASFQFIFPANTNEDQCFQSEEDDSAGGQSRRRSVQLSDQCPNWPSQERRDYRQCKPPFAFQLSKNTSHF